MTKKNYINRKGSVEDIRASLACSRASQCEGYSARDLKFSIADEKRNQNRSTVIKLLQAEMKRKTK